MHARTWLSAVCWLCLCAEPVQAQGAPPAPGPVPIYPRPSPPEPEPFPPGAYVVQPRPPPKPLSLSRHQKYPLKVDLQIEVPIPLTEDRDTWSAGFGFAVMFGWDLGFLVPTANLGWSWTGLELPQLSGDLDRSLTRFHFGFGLIAEFENRSVVTPVLGALLDFNWWHVSGDVSLVCGGYYYWACYQVADYEYTTGFTFKAGVDFKVPKNDRFGFGTGVLPSVTLSGGPFRDTEWWLSPYATFVIRN